MECKGTESQRVDALRPTKLPSLSPTPAQGNKTSRRTSIEHNALGPYLNSRRVTTSASSNLELSRIKDADEAYHYWKQQDAGESFSEFVVKYFSTQLSTHLITIIHRFFEILEKEVPENEDRLEIIFIWGVSLYSTEYYFCAFACFGLLKDTYGDWEKFINTLLKNIPKFENLIIKYFKFFKEIQQEGSGINETLTKRALAYEDGNIEKRLLRLGVDLVKEGKVDNARIDILYVVKKFTSKSSPQITKELMMLLCQNKVEITKINDFFSSSYPELGSFSWIYLSFTNLKLMESNGELNELKGQATLCLKNLYGEEEVESLYQKAMFFCFLTIDLVNPTSTIMAHQFFRSFKSNCGFSFYKMIIYLLNNEKEFNERINDVLTPFDGSNPFTDCTVKFDLERILIEGCKYQVKDDCLPIHKILLRFACYLYHHEANLLPLFFECLASYKQRWKKDFSSYDKPYLELVEYLIKHYSIRDLDNLYALASRDVDEVAWLEMAEFYVYKNKLKLALTCLKKYGGITSVPEQEAQKLKTVLAKLSKDELHTLGDAFCSVNAKNDSFAHACYSCAAKMTKKKKSIKEIWLSMAIRAINSNECDHAFRYLKKAERKAKSGTYRSLKDKAVKENNLPIALKCNQVLGEQCTEKEWKVLLEKAFESDAFDIVLPCLSSLGIESEKYLIAQIKLLKPLKSYQNLAKMDIPDLRKLFSNNSLINE